MKILVVGGCGFLGNQMVKYLLCENANEVYVIDNLSTGLKENVIPFLNNKNFKFINGDITKSNIIKTIKNLQFDRIYNFACPASPIYYLKHPVETWEASVLGVRNLLEAIKNSNTRLLQTSTSEVYGDAKINPQVEEYWGNVNPIGVRACYDEGKRAAEALIYDYIRLYDVDVRVVRIFNTYGPTMKEEDGRIMSNFIMQALNNKDITIYGTGEQTRSFCFVDDTINGLFKLMESKNKINSPINIGNPNEISVIEIAKIILKKVKSNSKLVFLNKMQDDPQIRQPNIDKAKKVLNWEPKICLNEGIDETIKYFKNKKH